MPSKSDTSDDFAFVMTCMQHCSEGFPKPGYEAVAKAIGAKSGNAWYVPLSVVWLQYGADLLGIATTVSGASRQTGA